MKYKARIVPHLNSVIVNIMRDNEAETIVRYKYFYRERKWFKYEPEDAQWERAKDWLAEQMERMDRFNAGVDIEL